jgi:hypothetical protein
MRLGVEWEPVVKGIADIRGFSAEELRKFSTRRAEILAAVGEDASARAMQVAALETRRAKDRDLTDESLREGWRVKAAEVGLDRETIARRLGHERPGRSVLGAQKIERSVTEHVSHFDRRDAIRAVADNLPHGAPAAEVERLADEYLASASVIRLAETPRGPRYTTERIWQLERQALAVAGRMQEDKDIAVVHPILVRRVLDAHLSLKADQRVMVERLLGDGRALEVVIGEAGTGKTYATTAAASAWSDAGFEVEAAAPTWRAATVLRSEGIPARTVSSLLARLDAAEEAGRPVLDPGSVLLVDEAGMVDSRTLTRLIDHAYRSEAKLVLLGDPEQLGEIEAGGLFAAIARRSEEIRLDEAIRHRHELDREAAKLIRGGQGSEALNRYAREGRVVVAADHELRREAIVSDWRAARRRGEDALMIAKLNTERERLNERAREAVRAEGRLGTEEIEVGGRHFAASDEVITRVNDQRAQIFNRERWRVEAVDPQAGAAVLVGIDTDRRLGVDAYYLERVNPSDGAPAIEHGYAVTIYQAQGSTLDSAYVMADPSMDRQEFYVAASRTRGETFFYATPEVGFDRMEFAPAPPRAEDLEHIARAAERDGSQAAAHDAALRERLARLSTEELHDRRRELASEAGAERANERHREELGRRLTGALELQERFARQGERLGKEPPVWARADRAAHGRETARITAGQDRAARDVAKTEAELRDAARVGYDGRAELAVAQHLISERVGARVTAVRIDPPDYIARELGDRPTDPTKRWTWDEAVSGIEAYRQQHGIRDGDTALGEPPKGSSPKLEHRQATKALERAQRQLGLERARARVREQTRSLEIEL